MHATEVYSGFKRNEIGAEKVKRIQVQFLEEPTLGSSQHPVILASEASNTSWTHTYSLIPRHTRTHLILKEVKSLEKKRKWNTLYRARQPSLRKAKLTYSLSYAGAKVFSICMYAKKGVVKVDLDTREQEAPGT